MAEIKEISKAKLFCGLMYNNKNVYDKVVSKLIDKYGPIEVESEPYPFDFTKYYEEEMGSNLIKKFIVFKFLIDRDELKEIKVYTNKIEDKYKMDGKRIINIDPGYITKTNLILASTKERSHRIYLGDGIFGDIVLNFNDKDVIELKNTFPDFRNIQVKEFFKEVRDKLSI